MDEAFDTGILECTRIDNFDIPNTNRIIVDRFACLVFINMMRKGAASILLENKFS